MSRLLYIVSGFVASSIVASAQIVITTSGTYTQDFNSLPTSGSATWTDNSTIAGWYAQRSGSGTTIVANAGAANTGALYSYGVGTESDRALGSVGSGTAGSFAYGVQLQNNSGVDLTLGTLSYTGEQWRNGGAGTAQTVTAWYQISSSAITSLNPGTSNTGWTAISAFDFTSPVATGSGAALVGNNSGNFTSISGSLSSITLTSGQYIMLRFSDVDHASSDHGLALDNFSLSYSVSAIPEPSTYAAIFGAVSLVGAVLWRRKRLRGGGSGLRFYIDR